MPRTSTAARSTVAAACLVLGVLGLSACTADAEPVETVSVTPIPTPTPTSTPTPTPTGPALVPEGSAKENLPYFTEIVDEVWDRGAPDNVAGRSYVDALVDGGFDKSAMELTQDLSTVGNPAESIQFSIRWGEDCLVGQVGPATGEPYATVLPILGTGTCLLGQTRPIDW